MTMRIVLVVLALAACDKGGKAAPTSRNAVIDAWKQGGLTPSAPTPAQVDVGKDCQGGTVGAIDFLLCTFASEAEAKAASDAGYKWVGEATGAVKINGPTLIAVVDRKKSDPSGRTINQLIKLAK